VDRSGAQSLRVSGKGLRVVASSSWSSWIDLSLHLETSFYREVAVRAEPRRRSMDEIYSRSCSIITVGGTVMGEFEVGFISLNDSLVADEMWSVRTCYQQWSEIDEIIMTLLFKQIWTAAMNLPRRYE